MPDAVFKGPMRFIKKHSALVERANPDILRATLKMDGEETELEENRLSITKNSGTYFYVYHMYNYMLPNGERGFGRWYNTRLQPSNVQMSPDGWFEYILEQYEDEETLQLVGPVTFRVQFAKKAAAKFHALLANGAAAPEQT